MNRRVRAFARNRRGLTLLEILLAAGLGLILMAAVYAALQQSFKLTVNGRVELDRAQIARALLQQMELDIRATMFDPETAQAATSTDSSSSSSSNSTSSSSGSSSDTSSTEEETEWTGSLGIRGSATELWLDISHVRRELQIIAEPVITASGTVTGSDLQTVAYFLSGATAMATQDSTSISGTGIARSQGDRSVLRTANEGSSQVLPGPAKVLAPEIDQLRFRYFDGLTWYDDWDSSTVGVLPRAVEITIGFVPPPKSGGVLLTPTVSTGTETYRLVIAIPVSDPFPPEEES